MTNKHDNKHDKKTKQKKTANGNDKTYLKIRQTLNDNH